MPKHIGNYSLAALENELEVEIDVGGLDETIMVKRSDNEYISDYDRSDCRGGYTVIRYSRCVRPSFHVKSAFMTLGLALPFTLALDAAKRLGLGKYTHYFHTANGDELGTSKSEAITRAAAVAEKMMRDGKYAEARSYFNVAFFLCDDSREEGFKERRDEAAEREERETEERERRRKERKAREREERQRQERERQARERQARERGERERQARERQEREEREREERERLERERQAIEIQERQTREREERQRQERERQARERQERQRHERQREERERQAREREERERLERERQERDRQARERQERQRQARERQERQRQARERQERQRQERERQERERQAREREEREQEEREQEAEAAYQSAQEIWSEAFILENNSAADAKQKFEESNKLFEKATTLMPHVSLYRNWFRISSLKLEGDSLFNEAVTLQEQGNILRGKQKYVEALQKYGEALNKYKEGYEMSKDSRFEACIEFVESCIREVDEIIQEGDVVERLQRTSMGSTEMNRNNSGDRNETLILHQVIDS